LSGFHILNQDNFFANNIRREEKVRVYAKVLGKARVMNYLLDQLSNDSEVFNQADLMKLEK